MSVRWIHKTITQDTDSGSLNLSLSYGKVVSDLLVLRGIKNDSDARVFFHPDLSQLHNPFQMKGMEEAIERISKAFLEKEKILVYGDYDVDGTTAVALVYSYLKLIHAEVNYYVPDRYSEGYGISFKGIDFASENGFSLIIALDCGIKSVDKVEYAKQKGIDFIICDHHLPGEILPNAVAILDPKQLDCAYPYKELSGCGIGYKLCQAFQLKNNQDIGLLNQFLDLVAVSIAADIVPITGENRVLAYYGLKELNKLNRPGFRSIFTLNKKSGVITVTDLVFVLAPRINAAGRLEHASKAVELLIATDEFEAVEIAKKINVTNTNRKDLDQSITVEAIRMVQSDDFYLASKSTVVFNQNWHKGVVGIVASRLVEKFYKPTVVLTESNGKATGSARSVKDFDVYDAIESCSHLLEQFGGHKYAAGLTLPLENVESFRREFDFIVSQKISDELLIPRLDIDSKINFLDINSNLVRHLKMFEPFGPGNMTPVFTTKGVMDTGWAKIVGNNHLKAEFFQIDNPTPRFQAIGFDFGDYLPILQNKIPLEICFTIEENNWNGAISTQLVIKGIRHC